jgi:hypothetical protein
MTPIARSFDLSALGPVLETLLQQTLHDLPKEQLVAALEAAHQAADKFVSAPDARTYVRAQVQEQFPAVPGFVANLLVELAVSLTRRGLTDLTHYADAQVERL